MSRIFFVAGALACVLPGAAFAQTTPPAAPDAAMAGQMPRGGGGGMARADLNGDGTISKAEAAALATKRFDAMDTNHDGVLTPDELAGPGGRQLARADTDGDGKISRAEYDFVAQRRFTRIDTNGDGTLSPEELRSWVDRARAARGAAGSDPADAVGPAPSPNPGQ